MPSLSERVAATRSPSVGPDLGDIDEFAGLRGRLHRRIVEALGPSLFDRTLSVVELRHRIRDVLETAMDQETQPFFTMDERVAFLSEIADAAVGYGPIDPLLNDPEVIELMVEGPSSVYYQKGGRISRSQVSFVNVEHLSRIIDKLLWTIGRRVDEATPVVDARLSDDSHITAIVHPVAIGGPYLTIRRYVVGPFQEADLIAFGTLTRRVAEFLHACVRARLNIIISGARSSGKTATMNVLSSYVGEGERIITLEDEPELRLSQERVLTLTSRSSDDTRGDVTIGDLVKNALRMIPDRVIVGEVRDAAALDLLQMMNTGHDGCLATVNSDSPRDTLSRIETMVRMAALEVPTSAVRELIASAVDLIVHVAHLEDGTRRITHVAEVSGVQNGVVTLNDLFVFNDDMGVDDEGVNMGHLVPTGIRPAFLVDIGNMGIHVATALFEPERRPDGAVPLH